MSKQRGILPPVPPLKVTDDRTGERGRLSLVRKRLAFVTDEGVRFRVKLSNIVNLELKGNVIELDTRLSGVSIRAVRFRVPKADGERWFRGIFFSWVLSKRRESKLALGWKPASFITKASRGAPDESSLEHDFLLCSLIGSSADRTRLEHLLDHEQAARLRSELEGLSPGEVVQKVASIEFEKMYAVVHRDGWRDSYESFDKGSTIAFQSALPTIHQRGMRDEFWGWYDINQMLVDRFRRAVRPKDRGAREVVKRLAALVRERIGEYAGLADEALRR